jgi:hypothetical protein
MEYKKLRKGKVNSNYNIDIQSFTIQEYEQRKGRIVKTVIINNKPLTRRDKVQFTCSECNEEVVMNPLSFAKRNGEKYCKGCATTIYHKRNPDWLVLTDKQKKVISERNSGHRIKEIETRICPVCKKVLI